MSTQGETDADGEVPSMAAYVAPALSVKIMMFDRSGICRCACFSDGRRGAGGVGASGGRSEAMVGSTISFRRVIAVTHDTSHLYFGSWVLVWLI